MKTILWITSIAMIVGLGICYYLWHIPKEMTLHQATDRGVVTMTATGIDLNNVTLNVSSDRHGFDVVIPAGTLFLNGNDDYQNMMVAKTVTVSFMAPDSLLQQQINLEVYSINLYLKIPDLNTSFTLAPFGSGSGSTEELQDPLFTFVQCLERHHSEEKHIRQLAVWIKSDNPTWVKYLDPSIIQRVITPEIVKETYEDTFGEPVSDEEANVILEDLRNIWSTTELFFLMKPVALPNIGRAQDLFEQCNVSTTDRNLFYEL